MSGSGAQVFTGMGGAAIVGSFGTALAAGDFDDDGFADLAAGAPAEDVGARFNAGALSILSGSAGGLTATGGQLFTQDSPGVPGTAEEFHSFGGNSFNAG